MFALNWLIQLFKSNIQAISKRFPVIHRLMSLLQVVKQAFVSGAPI